jgi:hypothetical protein
MENGS